MATVRIQGADEALKRLEDLSKAMRGRAVRRALGKGAAVVRKAAKENALRIDDPETGRRIADNIGQRVRSRISRRTGDQTVSVGVLTQKGRIPKGNPDTGRRGNTPHWHLVELGTEKAQAQPFLRPAMEQNAQAATDAFANALGAEIDKELAKVK